MDQLITENRTILRQLNANDIIKTLDAIEKDKQLSDYTTILQANSTKEQILRYPLRDYSFCSVLAKGNIFMTAQGICHDTERFYGSTYQLGNLSYDEVLELSASNGIEMRFFPNAGVRLDGVELHGILCLNPSMALEKASSFFLIKENDLNRILSPLTEMGGFSYITDKKGTLLYRFGDSEFEYISSEIADSYEADYLPENVYGKENVAVYSSLLSGLHIVYVSPKAAVFKNMNFMQNMLWILNVACVIVGLFLAWFLMVRKMNRMRSVITMLSPAKEGVKGSFYDVFEEGIINLQDRNDELNSAISSQRSILQEFFWEQLLEGRITQEEELEVLAQRSSLDLAADSYCVILLDVHTSYEKYEPEEIQKTEKKQHELLELLNTSPLLMNFVHIVGIQQIVIVVRLTSSQEEIYKQVVCEVLSDFSDRLNALNVYLIASTPTSKVTDIYYKYNDCKGRLNAYSTLESSPQGISWCSDILAQETDQIFFPNEIESRLTSGIFAAENDVVKKCFDTLASNNFSTRNINPIICELLIDKLKLILVSTYHEDMPFTIGEFIKKLHSIKTQALQITYLTETAIKICDFYKERQSGTSSGIKKDILDYVNTQIPNEGASLSSVAKHFHFNESYFSRIFKAMAGETFSAYIERIRMEEADNLLMTTSLKIEEIALKVSYLNASSFRRAYKRNIGIAPSQRRDNRKS